MLILYDKIKSSFIKTLSEIKNMYLFSFFGFYYYYLDCTLHSALDFLSLELYITETTYLAEKTVKLPKELLVDKRACMKIKLRLNS